ncbi:GntR family transcriptional regulator [Actinomycetospora cinnamomea]|uniref:DNA-binding GntR family transcriptional regulator n=1 Tax=Actinomycetospora cinnamomea TaxID=663609 RepID=A0A2U1FS20_9PSEU|nr:GntR family transcriptional regulator [Actinomycetospora cinnamomea]PVZ14954.1 DNA-binding GntR family transcriptional regulator [Actinomycetospora cinnamomea]
MPVPTDGPTVDRTLLRDDVYERLCDAIVDGTFAPGEQLRDAELAAWLGVSRTPVREAVLRLAQAGLVVAQPGRSTSVSALDLQAVRDAAAVVAAMHQLAVRDAVPALTEAHLREMREANDRFAAAIEARDLRAALRADAELHRIPVVVAGNRAVVTVLDQFTPVLRRAVRLRFASPEAQESLRRHDELIRRCAGGDVDGAAAIALHTWHSLTPGEPGHPDAADQARGGGGAPTGQVG